MIKTVYWLLALCPLTLALADEPALKRQILTSRVDNKDLSIGYLAHSFFYHYPRSTDVLKQIISAEGVDRILPAIAAHGREMTDTQVSEAKVRKFCTDLRNAKNGLEFAAVFASGEEQDRIMQQEAAHRIMSILNENDRKALEDYLDIEHRTGLVVSKIDYLVAFTSEPFPSTRTTAIMRRTCHSAAMAEGSAAP